MKKFFVPVLFLLASATPLHLNAALVSPPRPIVDTTVHTLVITTPTGVPAHPRSQALSATSSMERSLAAHFDATYGRTPEERKREERYRAIVADTTRPDAVRRRDLYELLEEVRGTLVAPRQGDLALIGNEEAPRFLDDGDPARLRVALDRAIADAKRGTTESLPFGARYVRRTDLLATLEDFRGLLNWNLTSAQLDAIVRARFDVYRSPGQYGTGGVLYTAYNDPVFEGSLTKSATYRYPLYRKPELAHLASAKFGRAEIQRGALAGHGLELVWLKHPAEAYLFELEGSGLVHLPDGSLFRVRYDGTNGRKYQGLGAEVERNGLLQPADQARAQGKLLYLNEPSRALAELARNPRVIFFEGERIAGGASDLDLVTGRSVAVDTQYFPRDGLGFMWLDQPVAGAGAKPAGYAPVSRFALSHDTGNAIRGPGRIDIYWGHDGVAQWAASQLRQPGSLYCLLRRGTPLLDVKPAPVSHDVIVVRNDLPRPAKATPVMVVADASLAQAGTPRRPVQAHAPSSRARRPSVSTKHQKRS